MLLFPVIGLLRVAWFRIASATLAFAPITKPQRTFARACGRERLSLVPLGACLVVMNSAFYLALDRQPIAPVAAIEFVSTIGIALWGLRTERNYPAFALAILEAALLINAPSLFEAEGEALTSDLLGLSWAVLNGGMFVFYILLGHRISKGGVSGRVERLGAAMTALTIV